MKIYLIAVGTKMPAWVNEAYQEYAKRLPDECRLQLIEIPALKRFKADNPQQILQQEGKKILEKIPSRARRVALDEHGRALDTRMLAQRLQAWMQGGTDIALLVGGPEGLSTECKEAADETWSLSALTLPHPLVRVIVAEALYRAWSVLKNHPYHRD
ncbi:MAG TPA: 23S rRNA (pseudouridine(1915)-N(3))-methyltransferase RlmH [Gammaproteobacteria bacterium]